ncbi:hypothetical protein VCHC06A1_0691 [Vibrio cholerae HC-06A1]|nr:hypothetical protein VCHC06A1_0691 [Vibrio cholerae HC-06A1]EMQ49311.1 hypothetical protein VCPCS023_000608 [Vibrio cholerae O1 str. PCS-023]
MSLIFHIKLKAMNDTSIDSFIILSTLLHALHSDTYLVDGMSME